MFSIYGLYLRFITYSQRPLNPDEMNQLNYTARGSLLPFWKMYTKGELTAFPGDYLLTFPFVKILGSNKWLITMPHIIATIIGFYLLYIICNKYLKSTLAVLMVFALVCLNYNLRYHAFEFRPYAVLPTLALAVFIISEHVVCNYDQLTRTQKTLIGLFFALTVAFHAYGILMIFLFMSYFVLSKSQEKPIIKIVQKILPFSLTVAVVTVPLFLWYYMQNNFSDGSFADRNINTFDFIPNPLSNPNGFLRAIFGNLIGAKTLNPLVIGILAAFVVPQKNKLNQIRFFLLLIVLPIELILLADLRTGYWFVQRQFVWVMPFFAFWLAWCWDSIFIFISEITYVRNLLRRFNNNSQ